MEWLNCLLRRLILKKKSKSSRQLSTPVSPAELELDSSFGLVDQNSSSVDDASLETPQRTPENFLFTLRNSPSVGRPMVEGMLKHLTEAEIDEVLSQVTPTQAKSYHYWLDEIKREANIRILPDS